MKRLVVLTSVLGLIASVVSAETTLNMRVQSAASPGENPLSVRPKQVVDYQVVGWLTDTENNEGLALFGFDLAYDCGFLTQATPPDETTQPGISQFVMPEGVTNPAGFGGSTDVPGRAGELVQIGGATNTINNVPTFYPFPIGAVVLGIGHGEAVLAEGSLTIPEGLLPGMVCNLVVANVFATTILEGQVDDGTYWAVEPTNQQGATIENLAMTAEGEDPIWAQPGCDASLTRPSNSVIRLYFPDPIEAPAAGELQVRELLPDGRLGATDLAGSLAISVEDGVVLRIAEAGSSIFQNETWYGVINMGGWSGVEPFEIDYRVVFGDANNTGFTNFADLSFCNANFADPTTDWDLCDVNASGFVNFADLSAIFAHSDSTAPEKPTGHACTISGPLPLMGEER